MGNPESWYRTRASQQMIYHWEKLSTVGLYPCLDTVGLSLWDLFQGGTGLTAVN
jgi:hypothetical protein